MKLPATSSRWTWRIIGTAALLLLMLFAGSLYYRLSPAGFVTQGARTLLAPVLGLIHRKDKVWVANATESYWHGIPAGTSAESLPVTSPFIYEDPDASYLRELRSVFALDQVITGAASEYDAILKLGGWVGSQFGHGTDPVVGGHNACRPVQLIEDGRSGSRFWCEIAARTMAHAATSLGLPARVITASTDGYTWEHAVTEIWSNEFRKWFVVDADFNIVYELHGVPLSALELVERGQRLEEEGLLNTRHIAPPKPGIPPGNALYVYRYVHVDLRNDWCTRSLHRGSPVGGDAATWWHAGSALSGRVLTAMKRVDDPMQFAWQVNQLIAIAVPAGARNSRQYAIAAFSPYFSHFEVANHITSAWVNHGSSVVLPDGSDVRIRVVTKQGWRGPEYRFTDGALRVGK
jgi:hypothetical protein